MNKETDISQISKYLNGKLDAKAMHQMEKRALDDPFLMNALEGYEANGKSQEKQLAEIAERLKKRIEQPVRRIVPWRYFAVAASVLIVATVGGILLFNRKNEKPQMAKVITPTNKKAAPGKEPVVNNEIAAVKPLPKVSEKKEGYQPDRAKREEKSIAYVSPVVVADQKVAAAPPKMAADETADKDTMPLNEMIVTEYTSGKKKDISQGIVATNLMKVKKADTVAVQKLQSAAPGAGYNNVSPRSQSYGYVLPVGGAEPKMNEIVTLHKAAAPDKTFAETKVVANDDSAKKLLPAATNAPLREVMIAQPATARISAEKAHPQKGWVSFKKYLDENAVSADKKTGTVTISFFVDANGVISNLQIVNGLSDATNQKALSLISNGPAWAGNTGGKPEKVEVKIRFDK